MFSEQLYAILSIVFAVILLAKWRDTLSSGGYYIAFRAAFQFAASKGYTIFGIIPWFTPVALAVIFSGLVILIKKMPRPPLPLAIYAYIIFSAISTLANLVNFTTLPNFLDGIFRLSVPLVCYLWAFRMPTSYEILMIGFKYIVLAALLPTFVALIQYFVYGGGYSLARDNMVEGTRIVGTVIDPNIFGIFLAFSIFSGFAVLMLGYRNKFFYALVGILFLTVILAQNRGTWIAMFFSIIFSVVIFHRRINVLKWMMLFGVAVMLSSPIIIARFADLDQVNEYGQSNDTFAERLMYQQLLVEQSLDAPILGHGYDSSVGIINSKLGVKVLPHNDYVRIAVESGYISCLSYISFILLLFYQVFYNSRNGLWKLRFVSLAFTTYLCVVSFAQNVVYDFLLFPMLMFFLGLAHTESYVSATFGRRFWSNGAQTAQGF